MGTSTNRNRLNPNIPLIPDWIPDEPLPDDEDGNEETEEGNEETDSPENEDAPQEEQQVVIEDTSNRFYQSQRAFKRAINSTSDRKGALTRVVKNYVSKAGGGSGNMTKRMRRSSSAIARFGGFLNDIQKNGLDQALKGIQLDQLINKSAVEILGALMDLVCGVGALLDDAITKQAYAQTIVRLDEENPGLDIKSLNEPQLCQMMATFLEETIVYRLISDIGRSLTVATFNVEESRQIEETLYQIVNGLVNATILPKLHEAVKDVKSLEKEMDKIYQIAFKSIINS
ncbi:Qat anti-phage system associated protein QatB [Mucilaginibacter sp.]|uniref:Qat anti-phage system associated protein QatB n=1 Tax=Mucilaginibacter sp. TaxID=1882438 RepID=UPI0035BC1E4A